MALLDSLGFEFSFTPATMALSCSPEECAALHNQLLHKITQNIPSVTLHQTLVKEFLNVASDLAFIPSLTETCLHCFLALCVTTYTGQASHGELSLTSQVSQSDVYEFSSEFLQTDHPFMILLYPAHVGPGRGRDLDAGLLLDTSTFRAHWHYLPSHLEPAEHWVPLDSVLRRWLALWDRGKYYWDDGLKYPRVHPWVESDLAESLFAWDELLDCIAGKLPLSSEQTLEWLPPVDKTLLSPILCLPVYGSIFVLCQTPNFSVDCAWYDRLLGGDLCCHV